VPDIETLDIQYVAVLVQHPDLQHEAPSSELCLVLSRESSKSFCVDIGSFADIVPLRTDGGKGIYFTEQHAIDIDLKEEDKNNRLVVHHDTCGSPKPGPSYITSKTKDQN